MYFLVGIAVGYMLGVISMVVLSLFKEKPPLAEIYERSGPKFIKPNNKKKPKVNDDYAAWLKENDNTIGG